MTLGIVMPKVQEVNQPNHSAQTGQQVSSPSFNDFLNHSSFGGSVQTRRLTSGDAELDAIFEAAGRRYNLSPDLLMAVAKVESNFRTDVTSSAGAVGIMQLMPATARHLGVDDRLNPRQNIFGGARYLREQLDRFDGDIQLALAAYNAGWPTVKRHGGIPPFRETQAYVPRVLGHLTDENIPPSMLALSFENSRVNAPSTAPATTPPQNNSNGSQSTTNNAGVVNNTFNLNFDEAMMQVFMNKIMNMVAESTNSNNN